MKKLTQAQDAILQGLVLLLLGALTTSLAAGYQFVASNGKLDVSILAVFIFNTFTLAIGKALLAYVPAHAIQLVQAEQDTQSQILDTLRTLQANQAASQQPPVVINVAHPTQGEQVPQPQPIVQEHVAQPPSALVSLQPGSNPVAGFSFDLGEGNVLEVPAIKATGTAADQDTMPRSAVVIRKPQ